MYGDVHREELDPDRGALRGAHPDNHEFQRETDSQSGVSSVFTTTRSKPIINAFPSDLPIDDSSDYKIKWANQTTGQPLPVEPAVAGQNVAAELDATLYQYIDPRWSGYSNQMKPTNGTGIDAHDVALLFIPPQLNDPLLPASPDNGSAYRVSLTDPTSIDDVLFYGFGAPNNTLQIGIYSNDVWTSASSNPAVLTANVPGSPGASYTGATICGGDSGGPGLRLIGDNRWLRRSNRRNPDRIHRREPEHYQKLRRQIRGSGLLVEDERRAALPELLYLYRTMGTWLRLRTRDPFQDCPPFDYARCWATPCSDDIDCKPIRYCAGTGSKMPLGTQCPVCTNSNDCSCIVGQCLPLLAPSTQGQACTDDTNCASDAPHCDTSTNTCQPAPADDGGDDSGDDGGND